MDPMKQTPKKNFDNTKTNNTINSNNSNYDKSSKSLWIGELEQWMDSSYLIESCLSYNIPIKSAKIIRDRKNGCSMGYGFLIFDSKEIAEKALSNLNGKIMPKTMNKPFKLNYASFNDRKNENQHSIYVCDLNPTVNSEQLISFFKSKYDSVTGGKIIVDPSTKLSKGYGFVNFSNEKEKEKAMNEMNGKMLNNKAIKTGNAWHKKNEKYKNKMMNQFHQHLFIQQQFQQFCNNPYYMANNYYANFFNPSPQQQMYSKLEEFINNNNDDNNGRNDFSNNVNIIGKEHNY